MTDRTVPVTRRVVLAGLGGAGLDLVLPGAKAQGQRQTLALQAKAGSLALRPGAATPVGLLQRAGSDAEWRFNRGDELAVSVESALPGKTALVWRGIDGAAMAEPLTSARPALAPGAKESLSLPLRHAGTFLCDGRLLADGAATPLASRALIVAEREAIAVDRDEVLLIEDWRLAADGSAMAPGSPAGDAAAIYTVNGKPQIEISAPANARLRLRFINSCQRNVIAVRIDGLAVRVMAIDGQPSEPFPARDGQIVLAPGNRIDVFVDLTGAAGSSAAIQLGDGGPIRSIGTLTTSSGPPLRPAPLPPAPPLPSNGLPTLLDLKSAQRINLSLPPGPGWAPAATWSNAAAPLFRAKRGRVVVLALGSTTPTPIVLNLHGHHVRLLDRLDDGWKPFWLDSLAVPPQQTLRVAFAAEFAGQFLIEAAAAEWSAPRLLHSYVIE